MIRRYRESDLADLLDLWYRASLQAHPFLDEAVLSVEREHMATLYLPNAETWVYVREGRAAGFVLLVDHEVGALFIDPDLHRQGMGRALIDHARALRGMLELDVFKENARARCFYDRYGFKVIKEHMHEATGHLLVRMQFQDNDDGCILLSKNTLPTMTPTAKRER